jgi:orotate phosphoribosyltransferase-like protein
MRRVDEKFVARIKEMRSRGMTQEEIAVELGVVQGTVSFILRSHGLGGRLAQANKRRKRA